MMRTRCGWTVEAVVVRINGVDVPQFKITDPQRRMLTPVGSKITYLDPAAVALALARHGLGLDDLQEVA